MPSTEFIRTTSVTNSGIKSSTTALANNVARLSYKITNLGTNPLYVKEGASASITDFSYPLAASTVNDNGTGASYDSPAGQIYTGIITIAGTSPRYTILERLVP